jgi:thiol-disulfide isomerase/thioredoxin
VGQSSQGNVLAVTGRDATPPEWWRIVTADGQEAWIFAELVDVRNAEEILVVAAPPTPTAAPQQPATEESSSSWVLVADSTHDFLGPIQDRQWAYFWSKGRNNYHFEEMTEMPNQCYHSPNDMTLEICRDQMTVDIHARGDAALQWKARESGSYRFEWDSDVVDGETTLRFSKQLEFLESQGPGSELPYSVTVYNVDQWEIFYWVPQYDTHYQVKIYKWQGEGESPRPTVEPSPVPPLAEATHILYFYFGAEGCPFSKSMAPKVERFHQEYGLATILPNEWNTGIGVLAALPPIQQADPRIEVKGVKVDWWGGSVNKFVRDTGITFPVVNDPGLSVDKSTFPITVVFNKQTGTHRVATRGDVSFADLESKVNAILDGEDVKPAQGGA